MTELVTSYGLTAADAPLWNTEAHHGSVVSVVTWMLIIATVLILAARVVTRYTTAGTLRWDDRLAVCATVTAIAQSIAVSLSSTNGLGSHAATLRPDQMDTVQKALYASLLSYIVTLGVAKSSVCVHIYTLSPLRASRWSSVVLVSLIGIWTITAMLVVAFQCKLPTPWVVSPSGKCINRLSFWTYYGTLNIITDVALIVLPLLIVAGLQTKASNKAVILACYFSRLSAIIAQILQLVYFRSDNFQTPSAKTLDLIYGLWIPTLLGQIVVFCSLTSTCFPYLKLLVDALETGMVRADGINNTHAQFRLTGANRSTEGYYKAQGSQFQKSPFISSNNEGLVANREGTTKSTKHRAETPPSMSAWGRKRQISRTGIAMQNLDAASNKEMDNNVMGRGSQGLPHRHFESTAYRGSDDIESQSSQTHIMRKVEWSMTEENSGIAA